jgi:outer membrane protein assembly factor BamB
MISWNITLGDGSAVHSSPKAKDGMIIVTSYDSRVYAIDSATGNLKWTFKGCGGQIHTTPALYDDGEKDLVIFGACDGQLYAINRLDGGLVWNHSAEYIPSSPSVSGKRVFFGSFDGFLRCVDAGNGNLIWSSELDGPIFSSPSTDGTFVCVGTDNGSLYLLDALEGQLMWKRSVTISSLDTSPVLAGEQILVTSEIGLQLLHISNGSVSRGFERGDASGGSPSFSNGILLFGDKQGYVHALKIGGTSDREPYEIGEEDEPGRDLVILFIGMLVFILTGVGLYIGYLRMRREQ